MSRAVAAAGLGAAGATAYLKPELARDWARDLVFGPSAPRSVDLGPVGKELESLQRLVEDLSRQVAAGQRGAGGVTVVHTGQTGAGGGTYLLYGAAACGLGTVLYLRLARGWTFGDMLYATRRGLRDGLAQVNSGLDQLGARLADVKARLQERIGALARRQEEMLGAQAEMRDKLGGVGRDVEHTRGQVGQIHAVVMDLEAALAEVGANQRHANHGIYVLCKAVSELMAGSPGIPSKAELIEYTQQAPVWAAPSASGGGPSGGGGGGDVPRIGGLESLLALPAGSGSSSGHEGEEGQGQGLRRVASARRADAGDSGRRSPFLLGPGSAAGSPPRGGSVPVEAWAAPGAYGLPTSGPSSVRVSG